MATRPLTVSFKFSVGKQYCVSTINFDVSDDPAQVISSFVESENVPVYLQNPVLWSICALFQAICDGADEQTEAVSNLNGCLTGARNLTRKYRQESTKWMKKSEVHEGIDNFTSSYRLLSNNKEWSDALVRVEKSYSMAMKKLIESRDHVLEALRNKQFKEMERQSSRPSEDGEGDFSKLSVIVQRHIDEMEQLEGKWRVEIEEAKACQKEEFHHFVISLKEEKEEEIRKQKEEPEKQEKLPQVTFASYEPQSDKIRSQKPVSSSLVPRDDKNDENGYEVEGKSREGASHSPRLSRWQETLEGVLGKSAESPSEMPPNPHAKSVKSSRPKKGADTFVMYLGTQRKHKYTINLLKGDLEDYVMPLYANTKHKRAGDDDPNADPSDPEGSSLFEQDVQELFSPYAPSLSGLVLLSDPNLALQSKAHQHLLRICNLSSEFHFPPVEEQFEVLTEKIQLQAEEAQEREGRRRASRGVQAEAKGTKEVKKGLDTGDFVTTKHSNLLHAQVVFHLAAKKENSPEVLNAILNGLRNILSLASKYTVKTLTIPCILIDQEARHLFTDAQLMRHCEQVFKTVKSFLMETTKSKHVGISTIQFVVPNSPEFGDKIRKLVADLRS